MAPWFVFSFVLTIVVVHPWNTSAVSAGFGTRSSLISGGQLLVGSELMAVLVVAGWLVYEGALTHWFGRTPGKAIMRIRPQWIGHQTSPPRFGRALGRSLAYWWWIFLPYIGGLLGFLAVLSGVWNDKRQCWHDRMCATVVVNDR
jgi:uncharacterized RDD family membrane protein YckC